MWSACNCRSTVDRGLLIRLRTSMALLPGLAARSSMSVSRSGGIESRAQRVASRNASCLGMPMATAPRMIWVSSLANLVGISGAWASMTSPR